MIWLSMRYATMRAADVLDNTHDTRANRVNSRILTEASGTENAIARRGGAVTDGNRYYKYRTCPPACEQ